MVNHEQKEEENMLFCLFDLVKITGHTLHWLKRVLAYPKALGPLGVKLVPEGIQGYRKA